MLYAGSSFCVLQGRHKRDAIGRRGGSFLVNHGGGPGRAGLLTIPAAQTQRQDDKVVVLVEFRDRHLADVAALAAGGNALVLVGLGLVDGLVYRAGGP
jgi:hypothetical protein